MYVAPFKVVQLTFGALHPIHLVQSFTTTLSLWMATSNAFGYVYCIISKRPYMPSNCSLVLSKLDLTLLSTHYNLIMG